MHNWLLPEAIEDLLPAEAAQVEHLRRQLLDEFVRHGYQLVAPPMLEFADALLSGSAADLNLRTFKLVDQLSGRTLALRADITPQVSRIDAHLLNRTGVTRLCYCGSVVHTLPAGLLATREPLQIGAELYGHTGLEADHEVIRLLARSLQLAESPPSRIDLSHVGIFRALTAGLPLAPGIDQPPGLDQQLFDALQSKDLPALRELTRDLPAPVRDGLLALPDLYGGTEVLAGAAASLPALPEITQALGELQRLADELSDLPLSFDLADLRGYHYHSGVVFAAYCDDSPAAVALGGRYDSIGERFGRGRPATGFSLDLRTLARLSLPLTMRGAILAPWPEHVVLQAEIERLRASGEIVVAALPGHANNWREAGCDRHLVWRDEQWIIEPLVEN
jgi:ATP phosphoribosyltransferase regulatory subunit